MPCYLSPVGNESAIDANGDALVGGKIYSYTAGTSTAAATFTTQAGSVQQANPIILNARGIPDNPIWLAAGQTYKLVFKDANDVTLQTIDNVSGINDPAQTGAVDQWVTYANAPTYISATSFSLQGDQTGTFHALRRIQSTNTAGTRYSTISSSSYNAGTGLTTVVVVNDSGTLDSGLSAVSYGFLTYTNDSIPVQAGQLIGVQTFTSSGTYTPTLGTVSVIVEVQAPGGGSGGCVATAVGEWAAGRPGGGGGWGRKRITSGFSGVAVTIGAAGAAGAAGDNAGGTGGTTSFGAALSCTGGAGGGGSGGVQTAAGVASGATNGGASGGSATGADVLRNGSCGGIPFAVAVSTVVRANGGDAYYGAGGQTGSVVSNNVAGQVGVGYGGGASGPVNANAVLAAQAGAAGAPGVVIVFEFA